MSFDTADKEAVQEIFIKYQQPYLRLRPHHIVCLRYLDPELLSDRGEEFLHAYRDVMVMLSSEAEAVIEVACGVDELCHHCSHLGKGKCVSPLGDEAKVRRWDFMVMEGLGLNYGERKTAADLKRYINQTVPLDFCKNRCPWKFICTVFNQ